jgi:hypothetical protein
MILSTLDRLTLLNELHYSGVAVIADTEPPLNEMQFKHLMLLLQKLRIFGEENIYHNNAYIEELLKTGEDLREKFSPSNDCVQVVNDILCAFR